MALVCFPVKKEHVPTVLKNVQLAAEHPAVSMVLLSAAVLNDCFMDLQTAIEQKATSSSPYPVPVRIAVQDRHGDKLRKGKGDGMNSALKFFLNAHEDAANDLRAPLTHIHFYDADIESFDNSWITKAEDGIALGYDIVRHYFPRSSTDAQVTWQITKVGFALLWPRTTLPWVQQPLGGELCFTRRVVEALIADERVMRQSNWGIDTLYTFVCAQNGFSLLEAYMPQGKLHALYGGLRDLKTMLCECFAAVQSLQHEEVHTAPSVHRIDPPAAVPASVTEKIGYNVEKTLKLLRENWNDRQLDLLTHFNARMQDGMVGASEWPEYDFMDEVTWIEAYKVFLQHFDLDDDDWRELLFKAWVARVLNYTMRHVLRGYHVALQANTDMVMRLHMHESMKLFDYGRVSSAIELADSDAQSVDSSPSPSPKDECALKQMFSTSPTLA